MGNWLLRAGGAAGMGLTWAAGWAVAGLLIGVSSLLLPWLPWDFFFRVFDAPLPALALPGSIAGVIFSVLIGFGERRRKLEELSSGRLAAWGALAGLLVSLVPAAMVAAGLATLNRPDFALWQMTAVIGGPLTLLGCVSGVAALLLARSARPWRKLLALLLGGE